MRLFLCEKPSQAKDIAKVLGAHHGIIPTAAATDLSRLAGKQRAVPTEELKRQALTSDSDESTRGGGGGGGGREEGNSSGEESDEGDGLLPQQVIALGWGHICRKR